MESDSESVSMDLFPRKEKVPGGETEEMEVEVELPSLVRPDKREREYEAEESSGPPPKMKKSVQGREFKQGQNSRPVLMDRTRTIHSLIHLSDSGSMDMESDSESLSMDLFPRKEKVLGGETEEMEVEVELPSLVRPDKREREPSESWTFELHQKEEK